MRRVILESPYAGDVERNVRYARACLRDSLKRDEAPLASHLLYTQPGVLDDTVPFERAKGITAGHLWYRAAERCVVYCDFGVTKGMMDGILEAQRFGCLIEFRRLGGEWKN